MSLRKKHVEELKLALGQDPSIACPESKAGSHPGNTLEYLISLGLSKSTLRKLEVLGMAQEGFIPEKSGWKSRWVLIIKEKK